MELDKTAIVLRQRPTTDLIDLSLVALKVYWKPILAYAVIGCIPFFLINSILLWPLRDYDTLVISSFAGFDEFAFRLRYLIYLMALTFIQLPLAMLGVTYYLGHSLFLQPTSFRDFGKRLWETKTGVFVVLGLMRFGLLGWLAVIIVPKTASIDPFLEIFWFGFVLLGAMIAVRAMRPFAPEILLLEQQPLRRHPQPGPNQGMAFRGRTNALHGPLSSDMLGRSVAFSFAILLVLISMTFGELFLTGVFFGVWTWEWWMDAIFFPINLWLVGLWGTVIRFLSYLDCRTRLEGWELDLRLRAESRRLAGAIDE